MELNETILYCVEWKDFLEIVTAVKVDFLKPVEANLLLRCVNVMSRSHEIHSFINGEFQVLIYVINKGVPKLTQDLNLIENTVFSLDYVIFLLNYKVHRIGLFVE